ncbi:COMM domain-containing protein 8 isoform X1 [Syngnathus acus]|uniref:COMM domain-containing protein 8 isoform X1 n=1 Tax=Syngnathus acus TaxID=161584 RepID=UPI001885AAC9|nr:COMM domain-containing protein 8 isoform X1 [Syngnathus acus]
MTARLNNLALTECHKLCHRVVDGLCGREAPRRDDYNASWSLDEWLDLIESLAALFRLSVGNNSSDEEVLLRLSELSSSHSEAVLNVLQGRRQEICHSLLATTDSISSAILHDFDWQLQLALSSDKISSLQTPLLSLHLDIRENGGLNSFTMEMNREELNTLITSLEAANKVNKHRCDTSAATVEMNTDRKEEAVRWHGGEKNPSAHACQQASKQTELGYACAKL